MKPKSKSKEERRSEWFVVAGLCVSLILVMIFSQAITAITAQMTYDATLSVKKTMLQENVRNLISYLDECADDYMSEHPDAGADELEQEIYDIAYRKIYSETHMDGTYMWVQKVINYDGGDDYAIRLIHPNLSDTEGDYLSTNTVNPSGILAYKEELEGVKKDGSIYLTYEFKKLGSDEVTRKVTFSELYKRFDWIVCMGVNIDDLDHYQDQARENMRLSQTLILTAISVTWIVLLYLMFHAYRRTNLKFFERKNKELSDQLEADIVTGAGSRVYGEKVLKHTLEAVSGGQSEDVLLIMLDVDYFKQINDKYGHETGDIVLRSFATAVKENIKSDDLVFRWGGDEFVALLYDVPRQTVPELADRIANAIRSIDIPGVEEGHSITASMGLTYFEDTDLEVKEVLARADEAVYRAKEAGRNNWKF